MRREIETINFGKWMKEQRKIRGISQDDFSQKVQSNKNTISRYETSDRFPPLDVAERIVNYFGAELVIREKGHEGTNKRGKN